MNTPASTSSAPAVLKLISTQAVPEEKALAFTNFLNNLNIAFDFIVDDRIAKVWLVDKLNPLGDCFLLTPANEVLHTMFDLTSWLERTGLKPIDSVRSA